MINPNVGEGKKMSTPAFVVAELKSDSGQTLAMISVTPKEFRTGSKGYYANQKVEIGGKRYQAQIQLVEIGSKPKAEEGKG
jgi:hypothetical protein